jgi:8-oxo-dGTP pyrophosphatase MutT (NUDIX family)
VQRVGVGRDDKRGSDGGLDTLVRLPASQVTSAAFGGADFSTLYITTAREGFTPADLREQPLAGDIFACTPGVAGRPPFLFAQGRGRRPSGDGLASRSVEPQPTQPLAMLFESYHPEGETETADMRRVRALADATNDPWRRELALHLTASALIVHPSTARVLLRWHQRQQAWLQVGGHGDPGEVDPLTVATREAYEETGLADLAPWPDAEIRHIAIVGVPAGKGEPAHQHADVRFFMATQTPDAARAENAHALLRWLSLPAAREATSEPNLKETLTRLERLLTH